jgi:hypothetical protein
VGHGDNAGGVNRADLLNDAKKIIDFAKHPGLLFGLERKPRQVGNPFNICICQ